MDQEHSTISSHSKNRPVQPRQTVAIAICSLAAISAIFLLIVNLTWSRYWFVETAMNVTINGGITSIALFFIGLIVCISAKECRSRAAWMLLILWAAVAVLYYIVDIYQISW